MAIHTLKPTDQAVIERVLAGEHDAFSVLVERYYRVVFGLCYAKLAARNDAEDATQETFLKAFTSLAKLRDKRGFGAWLCSIARNTSSTIVRKRRRTEANELQPHHAIASLADEIERRDLHETVHRHIQKVPEPYREVIVLHYLAEKKTREIGQLLGITWATARKRLQRGRELMSDSMAVELRGALLPQESEKERVRKTMGFVLAAPLGSPGPGAVPPFSTHGLWQYASAKLYLLIGGMAVVTVAAVLFSAADPKLPDTPDTQSQSPSQDAPSPGSIAVEEPVAAGPDRHASGASLSGTVYGPDGSPQAGATVEAIAIDWQEVTNSLLASQWHPQLARRQTVTGENGVYTFDNLKPSQFTLKAYTQALAAVAEADLRHENDLTVDFRLRPATSLAGRVTNEAESPIAGALVFAQRQSAGDIPKKGHGYAFCATTDDDGHFLLPGIWRDSWKLLVQAPGYASLLTRSYAPGQGNIQVILGHGAKVIGKVARKSDGAPVGGVRLQASSMDYWQEFRFTQSLADGSFTLPNLTKGNYVVYVEDPQYAATPGKRAAEIEADTTYRDFGFQVIEGATLSGKVTAADSGEALAGAKMYAVYEVHGDETVTLFDAARTTAFTFTDEQGSFEMTGLLPGLYGMFTDGAREYPSHKRKRWARIRLEEGEQRSGLTLTIPRGTPFSGVVLDSNGAPATDAEVLIYDEVTWRLCAQRLTSGEHGRFKAWIMRETESVYVVARRPGEASRYAGPMPISETPTVILEPAARISGRLVDTSGNPLKGWQLFIVNAELKPSTSVVNSETDEEGKFAISGIAPGLYDMSYVKPGQRYRSSDGIEQFEFEAGQNLTGVELVFDKGSVIAGKVTTADGIPLAGVQITTYGQVYQVASSDQQGRFECIRLGEGPYSLTASMDGYTDASVSGIPVGTTDVHLLLKAPAQVSGTVADDRTGMALEEFNLLLIKGKAQREDVDTLEPPMSIVDPKGRFTLPTLDADVTHTLVFSAPGYVSSFVDIPAMEPGTHLEELAVRLKAGCAASGIIANPEGQPLPGAQVYVGPLPTRLMRASLECLTTDSTGKYTIDVLPEGQAFFSVYHPDYAPAVISVDTTPRRTVDREVRLRPAAFMEGRVYAGGIPVSGAYVWAEYETPAGTIQDRLRTGPDGNYRMGPLPGTDVTFYVLTNPYAPRHEYLRLRKRMRTVEGNASQADFYLQPGASRLEGTIGFDAQTSHIHNVTWEMDTPEGLRYGWAWIDGDNVYHTGPLPAGVIKLTVEWCDYTNTSTRVFEVPVAADTVCPFDVAVP